MENPFLNPEEQLPNPGLNLSFIAKEYVKKTIKWTKFLAILSFILIGLMFISYAAVLLKSMGAIGIIALIFAAALLSLNVIPTIYLFQFSKYSKLALENDNNEYWEIALKYQSKLYQFIGILIIVVVAFYLIMFLCFGSFIMTQFRSQMQSINVQDTNAF
ncbi:hypothetical protein [Rhizosphaericola mali]|uniref:DUF5362 domain-containing protein n=1 Tax=Rhizosphaericola mali TaxID=2545455 RepID=A0A5P2G371_9BACT|nr:hypothetical protein [Rhizosphaericola mali]QES89168.1 hypothetical protein E0W69_011010 [Rhizosphaericola mali]